MKRLCILLLAILGLGTVGTFVKIFGLAFLSLWALTVGHVALCALALFFAYYLVWGWFYLLREIFRK